MNEEYSLKSSNSKGSMSKSFTYQILDNFVYITFMFAFLCKGERNSLRKREQSTDCSRFRGKFKPLIL